MVCFKYNRIIFLSSILSAIILSVSIDNACAASGKNTDYDFAEKLFQEGDYNSCLLETKRQLHFFPEDENKKNYERLLIKCRAALDDKQKLVVLIEEYIGKYPGEESDLYLDLSLSFFGRKTYNKSRRFLELAEQKQKPDEEREKTGFYDYYKGVLTLELLDFDAAAGAFKKISLKEGYDEKYRNPAAALSGELKEIKYPVKSAQFSGILSSLVPGLGQVYSGRALNGLYSFIINASLISAIVYSVKNEKPEAAAFFFVLEFPFYLGNIYNAASFAEKHNAALKGRVLMEIEKKTNYRGPISNQ